MGREQLEESSAAPEPTEPLPPSKGKWLAQENERWHKELRTDIAMLVHNKEEHMDLLEVFCEPTSQLTTSARGAGLKAERWSKEDFDLSRPAGCQAAMKRLRELRPKRLWLSPPCGPFSVMQNVNQRTPEQIKALTKKREHGFRMWQSCIRLAWLQVELGGSF